MEEKGAYPRSPGTPRNLFRGEEEGDEALRCQWQMQQR